MIDRTRQQRGHRSDSLALRPFPNSDASDEQRVCDERDDTAMERPPRTSARSARRARDRYIARDFFDEAIHAMRGEQADELVDRPCGMSDRENAGQGQPLSGADGQRRQHSLASSAIWRFGRNRLIRSEVHNTREVQLTDGRQGRLPPAVGTQPADSRILVRRPCDIQAGRAHGFGNNRRGVGSMCHYCSPTRL